MLEQTEERSSLSIPHGSTIHFHGKSEITEIQLLANFTG